MEQKQQQSLGPLIRQAMPKVAVMVADKRREWGDAHVTLCQQKGMAGEPGWFFAREGALAIGTPWRDDPLIEQFVLGRITPGQVVVVMRPPAPSAPSAPADGGQ